jgi:hypothetical protein
MIKHPNYTFSVHDKRLYTFFKGITVTPRFVRASSVSSHGRAAFTRDVSSLLRTAPFTRPTRLCVTSPLDKAKATARAAPSAPKQSTTPPRPCPHDLFPPSIGAHPTHSALNLSVPLAPKACNLRSRHGWKLHLRNNTHMI